MFAIACIVSGVIVKQRAYGTVVSTIGIPRPMCNKNQRCKHWKDGRRPAHAQKGGMRWGSGRAPNEWTQHELYRIPEELVEEWANYIAVHINEQDRGGSVSRHVAAETRNTSP